MRTRHSYTRYSSGPIARLALTGLVAATTVFNPRSAQAAPHAALVQANGLLAQSAPDQQTVAKAIRELEWFLDARLTWAQREQYQKCLNRDWTHMDRATRQKYLAKLDADLKALTTLTRQEDRWIHVRILPQFLQQVHQATGIDSQWAVAIYEAAHKAGGANNPVLVPGEPALTREMADAYCDYLDWVMDLSVIGGLNAQQRQTYQQYLVNDWKKMDRAAKEQFVAFLKRFEDLHQLGKTQVEEAFSAEHPRFMAQLKAAGNDEGARFLQSVYEQEQLVFAMKSGMQRSAYAANIAIIGNVRPSGH